MPQLPDSYLSVASQIPHIPDGLVHIPIDEATNEVRMALLRGVYGEGEVVVYRALKQALQRGQDLDASKFFELAARLEKALCRRQREVEALQASIDIIEGKGQEDRIAELLAKLAAAHTSLGQHTQAAIVLERASGRWRYKNDWYQLAFAYDYLGMAHQEQGDLVRAFRYFSDSLRLRQTQEQSNKDLPRPFDPTQQWIAGQSHQLLGQLFLQQGLIAEAIGHLESAATLFTPEPKARYYLTEVLILLATAYGKSRAPHQQELVLRSALQHADSLWFFYHAQAMVRRSLAELLIQQKKYSEARALLVTCLEKDRLYVEAADKGILLENNDRPDRTGALLALSYAREGNLTEAIAHQHNAIRTCQGQERRRVEASLYRELAQYYFQNGQRSQALEALETASQRQQVIPNILERIQELHQQGEAYLLVDQPAQAFRSLQEAVALYESLLPRLADPTQALAFPQFNCGPLFASLAQAQRLTGSSPAEILITQERGRQHFLALQLKSAPTNVLNLLPLAERQRFQVVRDALTHAGNALRSAAVGLGEISVPVARAQYEQALRRYQEQHLRLRGTYPLFEALTAPRPTTLEALKRQAKNNPDTLYLTFAVGEKTTEVLLLSTQGVQQKVLPLPRTLLEQQVSRWYRRLTTRTIKARQEEPADATELYNLLIAPLGSALQGKKRLVILPSGPLQQLPFAALRHPAGKRLIEQFAISHALSLSAAGRSQRSDVPRYFLGTAPSSERAEQSNSIPPLSTHLSPLHYAPIELKSVSRLFPRALLLTGREANETNLRRDLPQARWIHFATHAVLDSSQGLHSWLLLDPSDSTDGRLEARELLELSLNAELVTLSACSTARGQELVGEGLLGFAWAFQAAGCPRLLGTLWPVEDRLSPPFMERFYGHVKRGQAYDQALRKAILESMRLPEARHPHFWAAYCLTQKCG